MFNKKETKEATVVQDECLAVLAPTVDIQENDDGYTLYAEMPGVSKEDIEIAVDQDRVEIKAIARFKSKGDRIHTEFEPVKYERAFKLGRNIDRDRIKATTQQGILTLSLPKSELAKRRMIEIE